MGREHLRLPEGFRQDVEAAALVLAALFIAGALLVGAGEPARFCWSAGGHFGPVGACIRWTLLGAVGAPASALVPAIPVLVALCILDRFELRQTVQWVAFLVGMAVLISVAAALAHGGIAHPLQYDPISGLIGNATGMAMAKPMGVVGAWLILALAAYALAASTVLRGIGIRMLFGPRGPRTRRSAPRALSASAKPGEPTAASEPPMTDDAERVADAAFALPSPDLLVPAPVHTSGVQPVGEAFEFKLIAALRALSVDATIVGRTIGPSVARYDLQPAPTSPIRDGDALAASLSTALRSSVRISPIDERGMLGVELASAERRHVALRELIESPEYRQAPRSLPIALGRDLDGGAAVADLTRMPNLLIAGEAQSGKSVFLNSLIASLLYAHSPGTLRFLIADCDDAGLAQYNGLGHLSRPVVTDYRKVASLLELALLSMRGRGELRVASGARNIQEFNQRARDGALGALPAGTWVDGRVYTGGPLPYLVVIVDDLLDLMRTGGPEIERSVAQLAEKGRVVGVHLIGVTKHTEAEAVTEGFRAMFPARAAFRVAHPSRSRAIIDVAGAESLLGAGDMLFLAPGKSAPARIQAPFTSPEDMRRLILWYGGGGGPPEEPVPKPPQMEHVTAPADSAKTQSDKHLAA